jgi:hypothetical protein
MLLPAVLRVLTKMNFHRCDTITALLYQQARDAGRTGMSAGSEGLRCGRGGTARPATCTRRSSAGRPGRPA